MTLLGVPRSGGSRSKPLLQLGGMDWDSDQATAEWVQTIDINVIQPTPNISPCGSLGNVSGHTDSGSRLTLPGRPRVGSVFSLDSQDYDVNSIGSDSVFFEESNNNNNCDSPTTVLNKVSKSLVSDQGPSVKPKIRQQVHSFRIGIGASGASSPIPKLLEGKALQMPEIPAVTQQSGLIVPYGMHISSSCEKLAAHSTLTAQDSLSPRSSNASLQATSSIEEEPVISVYKVPSLRRCNSAETPAMKQQRIQEAVKRADSETKPMQRSDSMGGMYRRDSVSSSGSDDASESVSFHLMVPQLSYDCPSADTSRADSLPSSSPTPPDSPPTAKYVSPLKSELQSQIPSIFRGRGRAKRGFSETRNVLKRQYSQWIPSLSPQSSFSSSYPLPTYPELPGEDEEQQSSSALRPPPAFRDPSPLPLPSALNLPSPVDSLLDIEHPALDLPPLPLQEAQALSLDLPTTPTPPPDAFLDSPSSPPRHPLSPKISIESRDGKSYDSDSSSEVKETVC